MAKLVWRTKHCSRAISEPDGVGSTAIGHKRVRIILSASIADFMSDDPGDSIPAATLVAPKVHIAANWILWRRSDILPQDCSACFAIIISLNEIDTSSFSDGKTASHGR
jgi:hypothetical protein